MVCHLLSEQRLTGPPDYSTDPQHLASTSVRDVSGWCVQAPPARLSPSLAERPRRAAPLRSSDRGTKPSSSMISSLSRDSLFWKFSSLLSSLGLHQLVDQRRGRGEPHRQPPRWIHAKRVPVPAPCRVLRPVRPLNCRPGDDVLPAVHVHRHLSFNRKLWNSPAACSLDGRSVNPHSRRCSSGSMTVRGKRSQALIPVHVPIHNAVSVKSMSSSS